MDASIVDYLKRYADTRTHNGHYWIKDAHAVPTQGPRDGMQCGFGLNSIRRGRHSSVLDGRKADGKEGQEAAPRPLSSDFSRLSFIDFSLARRERLPWDSRL